MKNKNTNLYSKKIIERLREELRYEQNKTKKYLNVGGILLVVLDEKENILLINKKGCELLESEEKDLIGKNFLDNFLTKESRNEIRMIMKDGFNSHSDTINDLESELISASGKIKIIKCHCTILQDFGGNNVEILFSGEDITTIKFKEKALMESNLRFQNLFEKAPLGYQSLDINGNINEINQTWSSLLGYSKEEVIGKWFGSFLTPEYRDYFIKKFEVFKQQGKIHSEFNMICKNRSIKFVAFDGIIGYDDSHDFVQTYCNLNDITDRHNNQMRLKESEENLRLAQSIAKSGSWKLNLTNNCFQASDEALNIFELQHSKKALESWTIRELVDLDDLLKFDAALDNLINKNMPCDITFKIHTRNNHLKFINAKASYFNDLNNMPIKVIGIVCDITLEKNKEIELANINNHDYLTNLYNRRYYFVQFEKLDNPIYYPLGIMMMDVNGLKIINDAFGHAAGDEALKAIGQILQEVFEEKDIVSRIGGDEFTALLPNTTLEKLQKVKGKIGALIKRKKIKNIVLSLAVGYEIKDTGTEDVDEIQRLAENKMYKHKTNVSSSVRSNAIIAILSALNQKYAMEKKHSSQVSKLCKQIGIEMHLDGDKLEEIEQAGLYHDIGKISIPDEILNKPGKLTNEEFEIIKSHTEAGYQILRAADEYSELAVYALHHHEKWDGSGYPSKLKGEKIPFFARVITVADAYEAMTADRPYRKKLSNEYAVSEIIRCSGTQFDPEIAHVFVEKVLKKNWTK